MKRFQIVILTIMLASLSACATNSLPSSSTESSVSISVSNPQDFLSELEDMETGQILEELKISDGGCLNVANGFTYFLQDFKLQGCKVGNGDSDFAGQGVVRHTVFVQIPGNLIEVAADFSVFGGQPANGRQQFIIDRGNGNDGANGRPCNGLPDKFGLAHVIVFQPLGEVGVFFLGHAGFDHMAAVGRVVFFLQALTSFLARQGA